MSTGTYYGITLYLFHCGPLLHVIVLEAHVGFTVSLNMHAVGFTFSGRKQLHSGGIIWME
jgi:hypothetical protein